VTDGISVESHADDLAALLDALDIDSAAVVGHSMGTLVVETTSGALRGRVEDGLAVFRGVRYAAPPVGPRRFRPPEPLPRPSGIVDATRSARPPRNPRPG
jgi:para-nitrobenzyl esterase